MSVSASIDLTLFKKDNTVSSSKDIIKEMIKNGWKLERNDKVLFLPVGDNDLFNWQEENINNINLYDIFLKKESNKEIVGINLYWKNSDVGISMLIFNCKEVSINLSINRVKMDLLEIDVTDVNWYLKNILSCFTNNLIPQKILFSQD